jgi:hypothetical protein
VRVGATVGAVVGAGVGALVVAGGVGVGAAVVGGAVVGAVVCVGGALVGATVARTVAGGDDGEGAALALALGDEDAEAGSSRAPPPRKSTPMTSTVSRLPAIAASARSIQRGPARRGGGMILVVSPGDWLAMTQSVARAVPPQDERALTREPAVMSN